MSAMDGDWHLVSYNPHSGVKVWMLDLGTHIAVRRDIPMDDVLDQAAIDRAANAGKKWGDGQVVGRVPISLAHSSGYMEARKNGDDAWIKRFWNDPDHARLRTFEGTV